MQISDEDDLIETLEALGGDEPGYSLIEKAELLEEMSDEPACEGCGGLGYIERNPVDAEDIPTNQPCPMCEVEL